MNVAHAGTPFMLALRASCVALPVNGLHARVQGSRFALAQRVPAACYSIYSPGAERPACFRATAHNVVYANPYGS